MLELPLNIAHVIHHLYFPLPHYICAIIKIGMTKRFYALGLLFCLVLLCVGIVEKTPILKQQSSLSPITPSPTPLSIIPFPQKLTPNLIAPNLSWNVPANQLDPVATVEIQIALKTRYATHPPQNETGLVGIINAYPEGKDVMSLGEALYDPVTHNIVPTDGFALYARKLSTGWKVVEPSDDDYCTLIFSQFPTGTVDYYGTCTKN